MDIELIKKLQAYGFVIFVVVACIGVYAYWFHLKRSEKTGRRNYEQYGNLALNDELSDDVLEVRTPKKEEKGK